MKKILQTYMRRLVNLSTTNRSIFLGKPSLSRDLDLHALDFADQSPSFYIIESFLKGKTKIRLCAIQDSRAKSVNEVSRRLKLLSRKDKFLQQESGAKDLHLAWPFLEGSFAEGSSVRAPLFYFPCELIEEQGYWMLALREEEKFFFNRSLFMAYSYYQKITIPEEWWEQSPEEWIGEDAISFLNTVYEKLKASPFEVQFNRELYDGKLRHFREWKREELSQAYGAGVMKLQPEALLGLFPQSDSYLIPDYEKLIEETKEGDLTQLFGDKLTHYHATQIKEENLYSCFEVDGAQEEVLRQVRQGQSIVVQGPPGSGKSELICNLVADYTGRGKKVLVVSQKRAALDVVARRLSQSGFENFLALVHDHKSDRKDLYEQIGKQIDLVQQYYKENNGLDIFRLERSFLDYSRQAEQALKQLQAFDEALVKEDRFGISAKELYLTTGAERMENWDATLISGLNWEEYRVLRQRLALLLPLMQPIDANHPWYYRRSFALLSAEEMKRLPEVMNAMASAEEEGQRLMKTAGMEMTDDSWDHWPSLLPALTRAQQARKEISKEDWKSFLEAAHLHIPVTAAMLKTATEEAVYTDLRSLEDQVYFREKLKEWKDWSGLRWQWFQWFDADRKRLNASLQRQQLPLSPDGVKTLHKRFMALASWKKALSTEELPAGNYQPLYERILLLNKWSAEAKLWMGDAVLTSFLLKDVPPEQWSALIQYWEHFDRKNIQWDNLIHPQQRSLIRAGVEVKVFTNALANDGDRLKAIDQETEKLNHTEKKILHSLLPKLKERSSEETLLLLDHTVQQAWIEELEHHHPELKICSSGMSEVLETQLRQALREKKKIEKEIVLARLKENTYTGLEYNRLQNMVSYRELRHQVGKKRLVWPLRKLVAAHQEELLTLIPCWLASPETVSAVFPLEAHFDLVIFDEASQCFAEKAIPAALRGKQVVVAGDRHQLQPNELYQIRWEEEEEYAEPELEIESWLDLANMFFPSVMLKGHYRSRYPELIGFSNKNFYENKLRFLPHKKDLTAARKPIEYIKVDGVWEQQHNEVEAEEIVRQVMHYHQENPDRSLGVVTFNFRQTEWIDELLETRYAEAGRLRPASLFVKNIENIQGDERDVIFFSVAYAPDRAGKFSMQFGSLNLEGGENRLNVAVTRAREKIVVVTSILPQQLKTENSLHKGPALLKAYLEYAWQVANGKHELAIPAEHKHRAGWYLGPLLAEHIQSLRPADRLEAPFPDHGWMLSRNHQPVSIILTDDQEGGSAKEWYAWLPERLEKRGWPWQRAYSRKYFESGFTEFKD